MFVESTTMSNQERVAALDIGRRRWWCVRLPDREAEAAVQRSLDAFDDGAVAGELGNRWLGWA